MSKYEAFNNCLQSLVGVLLDNDMPIELLDKNMKGWRAYIDSLIEELKEDDRYWFEFGFGEEEKKDDQKSDK